MQVCAWIIHFNIIYMMVSASGDQRSLADFLFFTITPLLRNVFPSWQRS